MHDTAPRGDLIARATPFLPKGTVVRQAFIAQSAPHFGYFLLTYATGYMGRNTYLCVAVTDEAIYVLETTKASGGGKPKRLLGTMPRNTHLGPVHGRWARLTLLDNPHCWVHNRFFAQIQAADQSLGSH